MKRTQMKNNEKIWKLEYWESISHQEPDEQNNVNEVDEITDKSA